MKPGAKVHKHSDKIVIFYSPWCAYSQKALELAKIKNVEYRAYDIGAITQDIDILLEHFRQDYPELGVTSTHKTRPIVFVDGKFIGGYSHIQLTL
jgi:glutaredoxin